ncbi:PQQ-binding-like beta-propeller repeat protein [Streptomyces sp. CAI-121]|uniref:serine/threonine-protein kinase n=1 Tax=unclassified Streptomyces TaxID=2593676 RepID=UPI00158753E0|nr:MULTISPECIES: serine/threonine-protein kinase [unclassified Streptomyces]NUV69909.1 PQQ-binding-like beta-propeller repeat protein [Streptomyces sp. CAI-121]NUW16319.1 PQQ-binding-like beta-propeller repeat protein [Streptomyces sp. CAI-68]
MKPLESGDPIRLGPYRIHSVLGEGGMGKVYIGQDGEGRVAAVKVLHPHLTHDANLTQRFVREAQMARAVTAGTVARVLDARTEGGRPWIATEFLAGPTLADSVRSHGPFDEPTVRALAAALARALGDIHAAGLVHRDLKPANIVLTATGPRVIDFGIARPEHGLTLTTTGETPITPGYGAPEQVLGRRVGPPADVFSLGAVLVYAASGQHAYEGSHVAAVQYEVVHGTPRLDRVPPALQPLIGPCLAQDPAFRPVPDQIIQHFAPPRGAERVWRKGPIAKDITSHEHRLHQLTTLPAGSAPPPVSRRRLLTGLAVGGSVLAVGGTAAWWNRKAGDGGPFDVPPAVPAPKARVLDAKKGDYVLGETPEPLWKAPSALAEIRAAPLPVRDVLIVAAAKGGIAARSVVDGSVRWSAPDVMAAGLFLSLSDRLVAAVDRDGTLVTFVASTGEPKWASPAQAASLLAADAEAVYVITEDGRVRAIGRSDAKVRWTVKVDADLGEKAASRGLAAQRRLVITAADGSVLALDTADGRQVWQHRQLTDSGRARADQSDGTLCVTGKQLSAFDLLSGKKHWSTKSPKLPNGDPAFWSSPTIDGRIVYATEVIFPVQIDIRTGKTTDWSYTGLLECDAGSPLVLQGSALWSVASDGKRAAVRALDLSADPQPTWMFPVLENPDQYWLTGDANRVFVLDGTSLSALPVF